MPAPSRVYLAPGMFGFARLASFDYFEHVVRAVHERFRAHDRPVDVHVVEVHPTASVRRRAATLARMVADTAGGDAGPIHLLGHSTGGLDARLVASPSVHLGAGAPPLDWAGRVASVTSVNTPHFGTPLAGFFATVSGQRLLYAVSALTVAGLKLGAPPLAATGALVGAFGRLQLDRFEIELVDRTVESVVRVLDDASSRELRAWLKLVRDDQGAIVQLMPEAMDLFQAGIEDRPGVRYQSVATFAPGRAATQWLASLLSPWGALSATIFAALYQITARQSERYPCAPPDGSAQERVRTLLGEVPPAGANDGIVPLYSQVWGDLIWVGHADHHDIVGHFAGPRIGRRVAQAGGLGAMTPEVHTDWLASGAGFTRVRFDLVMDRIVDGMLLAEDRRAGRGAPRSTRSVA